MQFKNLSFFLAALCASIQSISAKRNKLGFDIYGDIDPFNPSKSVKVDPDTCKYVAKVHLDFVSANPPFPSGAEDCSLEKQACNGKSCLFEVRNVYKLGKKFEKITGFNHIGVDWSPCGHPPFELYARPHWNLHTFRITPKERENIYCENMLDPFICNFEEEQPNVEGRKFFHFNTDAITGKVANVPANFTAHLDSAVPGEGVHIYDKDSAQKVADWDRPQLIQGLYNGKINFWEPMFPVEFVTGSDATFYEEEVTYVSQTIDSLPSYWSMEYNPADGVTTLIMKGKAEKCPKKKG